MILVSLIVIGLALGFITYDRPPVTTPPPLVLTGPTSGIMAPPVPFPALVLDGVSLPDPTAQGYTLVNVFASWCAPCLAEWPHLQALNTLPELKTVGIGFASDTGLDAFLAKHGNPFDVIGRDTKGDVLQHLRAAGLPETYLLNPQGQIVFRRSGPLLAEDVATLKSLAIY